MLSFTKKEKSLLKKLNTPAKVQDFLNSLRFNFEEKGETLVSPVLTLRAGKAHCFEGALLGAYLLSLHGYKPLIMHLKTTKEDFDHVVALFQKDGYWGALSKTNHAVLRYREPVYKNIRELAMSYFHEYFLDNGVKTLRQYSAPLDLNVFEKNWTMEDGDLWGIDEELDKIKHYDIAPKKALKNLRRAEKIEIEAGKIVEYKKRK
jgi:hypothetical protein